MNDPERRKCLVKDCRNHSGEGRFVGDLCAPCHHFLTTLEGGRGKSQAARNAIWYAQRTLERKLRDLGGAYDADLLR